MTYKQRRDVGGWTRAEIASLAGISESTLYRIEQRGVNPNNLTKRAIDAALAIKEAESKVEAL